jgi:hypothetical protein
MDAELTKFLRQNAPAFTQRLGSDRWYLVAVSIKREKQKKVKRGNPFILIETIA